MKKKLIIAGIILLTLTGCKIEYKIDIDKYLNLNEEIILYSTTDNDQTKFNDFNWFIPLNKDIHDINSFETKTENIEYYNNQKNNSTITFNYKYRNADYEKYNNSTLINLAFEYLSITKIDKDKLIISTAKGMDLFDKYDVEEVKITIHTNYKATETNADEVTNHNYTWIFNPDNASTKSIYINLDITKENLSLYNKILQGNYFNMFTLSVLIFLIGTIIFIILKKNNERKNSV